MRLRSPLAFLNVRRRLHELVGKPFSGDLFDDIHSIVVTECSREFLVRHIRAVFLVTPELRKPSRIVDPEHVIIKFFPTHVFFVAGIL